MEGCSSPTRNGLIADAKRMIVLVGFDLVKINMVNMLPNQLVPRDRNPRERGFRPVNSDR